MPQLRMQTQIDPFLYRLRDGSVAGFIAGILFSSMMAVTGVIPLVAQLVGSSSFLVGFMLHLLIASVIGALFGLLLGEKNTDLENSLAWGGAYGLLWWFLGPLLIMPYWLGMPLFQLSDMTLMSLAGHLMYGTLTAAIFFWQQEPNEEE